MIKSVAYFPSQSARNSGPVLSATLQALNNRGIETKENSMDADAAVIWSVLWAGRMAPNQSVYMHYRNLGRPVIVIDIGALYRGETWKIAVNNITAQGYYGHGQNLDWDRPKKLGISLAINLSRNPRVIIAAQHSQSLQVQNLLSVESWINDQLGKLRTVSDRPVTIRPHPRCQLDLRQLKLDSNTSIEQPQRLHNTYDSYNLAFDCHAMINHNSGPGIQAALAGTRPIVDQTSLAYPVAVTFEQIDQPYNLERDQWLVEICHTEYTLAEIQQGTWIDRLAPAL